MSAVAESLLPWYTGESRGTASGTSTWPFMGDAMPIGWQAESCLDVWTTLTLTVGQGQRDDSGTVQLRSQRYTDASAGRGLAILDGLTYIVQIRVDP